MSLQGRLDHHRFGGAVNVKRCAVVGVSAIVVIAGILLFTEHRPHVLDALVWLPFLACPLMHLFMHGGHGAHRGHDGGGNRIDQGRAS